MKNLAGDNMDRPAVAALFDVNGTLYKAGMGWGLLKYASSHGHRTEALLYQAATMPLYLLNKLKLVGREPFHRKAIEWMAWLVRGWSVEQAMAAHQWVARDFILPTENPSVTVRFREHLVKGHLLVLVSGMPVECLELIGQQLGATGVIGTSFELKDNRYTGRVTPPAVIGIEKERQVRRFFEDRNIEVDWGASYGYADSISDRDLLEMVGHPTATFPGGEMRALALEKRWEIIDT
ncbi:MAG: HAD-IB family hydrolase [Anaerolineales bacterium]|nr:HAD-IB family hydrolase [Anaerolineales bacterium]